MASWRDDELVAHLQQVFRGEHGPALAEMLRRKVAEIGPPENSALQHHNGERSFAADLLRLGQNRAGPFESTKEPPREGGRIPGRRLPRDFADETS